MKYFVISGAVVATICLVIVNLILNHLFGFDEELLKEVKRDMGGIVVKGILHVVVFLILMVITVMLIT